MLHSLTVVVVDLQFPGPSGMSRNSVPQPQDDTMTSSTSTAIIVLPPSESTDGASKTSDMDIEQPVRNSTLKRKRYGSGLGNLGNTCFMNSTLQCLAHTEPLRRYFCSGAYQNDLNRENPLGTGGELATTFAELLCEMWGSRETATTSFNGVVYPRSFKYTLGKHAEQFLGYDQHDSQELATYLLDALHEDTNRVTKKPYVEKPEQGEDEPDDIAAKKAWEFHLQREDSRVLENFVGQVKSRVQCPTEGCGRVSTTFDPFMYLSVPIPGATDRTLKVTLVPIQGTRREMQVTVPKTGTILTLQTNVVEQSRKLGLEGIDLKDLIAVDVWNNEVYTVYKPSDEIDRLRDTDITFVYQLTPSSQLRALEACMPAIIVPEKRHRPNRIKPSVEDLVVLNQNENWIKTIEGHVDNIALTSMLFNPNRATKESLHRFYDQLGEFIDKCYEALQSVTIDEVDSENEDDGDADVKSVRLEDLENRAIDAVCRASALFSRVSEVKDIANLEFAESKLRAHIIDHIRNVEEKDKAGISIQVLFHRRERAIGMHRSQTHKSFTSPLCLRIESNTTVYGLREILAQRLPFKDEGPPPTQPSNLVACDVEKSTENELMPSAFTSGKEVVNDNQHSDPGLLVMRQVPLGYVDQKANTSSYRPSYSHPVQLGMLEQLDDSAYNGPPIHLADKDSIEERKTLKEVIGNGGAVHLFWPSGLCDRFFDLEKYEEAEQVTSPEALVAKQHQNVLSVSQCIEKYCQMEQLEESEMWYCNKCKDHVRAWKQFHLYRTPPILIVHLKRFHYSASTHRRDKIDSFIDFPLVGLDLTTEVMHWTDDEKPLYDCYAVSNHYGGLGGGHYTAYALSDDGTWCHYDDSRVSTNVDPKDVVSSAAYVLYYKRRDVDFATPEYDAPLPSIVQDVGDHLLHEDANLVRVDSMDLDDRAVAGSPVSSNTSTSAMAGMSPQDDDYGFEKTDYESDHLPADHI